MTTEELGPDDPGPNDGTHRLREAPDDDVERDEIASSVELRDVARVDREVTDLVGGHDPAGERAA